MIRRCCSSIIGFAKRRPSLFIFIIIAIVFILLYGTYQALHLTSSDKFCGMCHVMSEEGPGAEYNTWKKSAHAYAGVGCIDCHGKPGLLGYGKAKIGGLYDLYGEFFHSTEFKMDVLTKGATDKAYAANLVPKETCLFCHTTQVNKQVRDDTVMSFFGVKMRMIDKVVNPEFLEKEGMQDIFLHADRIGANAKHATHINTVGLNCMNCHMGIAHSGEYYTMTKKMEDCYTCHDAERTAGKFTKMPANDDCLSCHTNKESIQKGDFLEKYGIDNQSWLMPSVTCDGCHDTAFSKPTVQKCVDCHDSSYGDMFTEWQKSYDENISILTAYWESFLPLEISMKGDVRTKFNDFKYLYKIVANDKSKSIHNTYYISDIMDKAKNLATELEAELKKK